MPSVPAAKPPRIPCPVQEVLNIYHQELPGLPQARLVTEARAKAIRKRWAWILASKRSDGTPRASTEREALDWLRHFFQRARINDFLMGRTPRSAEHANWSCDLDFLMSEKGLIHVIERTGGPA